MAGYIGSKASVVSSGAERKKTFTITGSTTSLTGCNYTVGKVHVFQNGVRLVDGTDYTATNGTTITLTVAAQNGDNVVVISQASYQVALSGIDDQSNATAITIDSSENVMVGNTDPTPYTRTSGNAIAIGDGLISSAQSGGNAAIFNRMTNDGSIVGFRKGGTSVGSIGVDNNTRLYFTNNTGAGLFLSDGSQVEPMSNGTRTDDTMSLGGSVYRFRNAYLSGGVYLGGTGSANKLDDYEEGDFTPTPNSGSYSSAGGKYTKVGRVVTLNFDIYVGSSGAGAFMTLPFSSTTTTSNAIYTSPQNFASGRTAFYGVAAGTTLYFRVTGDNIAYSAQGLDANVVLHASITYQTT